MDQPVPTVAIDAELLVPEIPYLRRYARALTRNASSADDLVQDALVRAVSNLERFENGTNLRAWLLTIVHNCFIDGTRKAKRSRDGDHEAEERMSGLYTRPNQIANLEMRDLQVALNGLPEEQRHTLVLVALEDMSYEEAARVTGVPVGTIRSRLSRARHSLMAMVAGLEIGDISPESGITRRKKPRTAAPVRRPSESPRGMYQRAP
ncbi:MAG TPA: sigma-70 family RNA polymerase sigma factor [Alphaproteobacteria bacterium]|jgi:RNA polymerase sigma-70 factor (ECF subfamily)